MGASSTSFHPSQSEKLRWMPTGLGLLTATALTWAQFRGFDPLDAATHFLTYQFPADNPDTHTHYAQLARPLWLMCGSNIIWFRLLTLLLVAGSTWVFWRAWRPLLAENDDSVPAGLSLGLSALAGVAWVPVLLGYNSLATIFALLGLGALAPIIGISAGSSMGTLRHAIGALLFLLAVGLAMLAKPPAGLALAIFGGLLVLNRWRLPRALNWILFFLATAAASAALIVLGRAIATPGFDPAALFSFGGLNISPAWIVATVDRYAAELAPFRASLGHDTLFIILPAVMLALVVYRRARGLLCPRWLVSAALVASCIALVAAAALRGLWDGSYTHAVSGEMARFYLLFWLTLAPALFTCLWVPGAAGTDARRCAPIVAALFFLPPMSGLGSTNTLYFSALHGTVFWTAGILLAARCIATVTHLPRLNFGVACALSLVGAAHLFSGHFLRPYMNQPPLWRQNIPVSVGWPATTLRLDPASARFIAEVRASLVTHGFRPGDDIFGFFNVPGIIYAVGAKQPGAPWYFGTWYGGDDTDGGKIRQVPLERRQRAWIITQADLSAFSRQFRECAIDFPSAYEKIGETVNPSTALPIAIWKPRARP